MDARLVTVFLWVGAAEALAQPYPLCDKNTWASHNPSKAFELLTEKAPSTGTEIKSPADISPSNAWTKSFEKGALAPKLSSRWSEAYGNLRVLPPNEQTKLLLDSGLGTKLAVGAVEPNASELVRRLELVSVKANISSLQQTIDRRMLEAYLGPQGPKLSDKTLLEKYNDESFKALASRIAPLKLGSAVIKIPGQEVQMVGAGDGGRPGGLGLVPKGTPVTYGTTNGGDRCLRPMIAADWKLNSSTNRISRVWDPRGFRDVGMLLWRARSSIAASRPISVCSFVRIGVNHVVTAAHCVLRPNVGSDVIKRDFSFSSIEAIALLRKLDDSTESPAECFDKPKSCGYFVSSVKNAAELPIGLVWPDGKGVPRPDVALLRVSFDPGAPSPTTAIVNSPAGTEGLTLAGYGLTNATNAFERGSLLVGWQQKPATWESGTLVWSVDINNGAAGGCGGDSGGAVYDGDIAGAPGDSPLLLAVISSGDVSSAASSELGGCLASKRGRAARLDIHRNWICDVSGGSVNGCAAK